MPTMRFTSGPASNLAYVPTPGPTSTTTRGPGAASKPTRSFIQDLPSAELMGMAAGRPSCVTDFRQHDLAISRP